LTLRHQQQQHHLLRLLLLLEVICWVDWECLHQQQQQQHQGARLVWEWVVCWTCIQCLAAPPPWAIQQQQGLGVGVQTSWIWDSSP
jgi:hypothetical protein